MYVLGISAYYHDSAACLIKDGEILCAIEEERFSRIKHDNQFPHRAINFCLKSQNLEISQVEAIAYYEKPLLKLERILETFVETYPFSANTFVKSIPEWLGEKLKIEQLIQKKLNYQKKIYFIPHHLSHCSASYFTSNFNKTAALTVDGVGEKITTGLWKCERGKMQLISYLNFPNSLGLFYSTLTAFLGFKVNEDEYKLMGLSAYGKPIYLDKLKRVIHLKKDGSFRLNLKYFSFRERFQMWSGRMEKLLGKPRHKKDLFLKRHKDLAASVQVLTEEIYFKILNQLFRLTNSRSLCISGGVALNALANGKIYKKTPFKKVHIFGAAGDSGAAVGAALYVCNFLNVHKNKKCKNQESHLYLGSSFSDREIEDMLKNKELNLNYQKISDNQQLIKKIANLLDKGKIIALFQGKAEFGPRALGHRSILANPKNKKMKTRVNLIKKREQFRPFAGSVLQDKVSDLFEVPEDNHFSPNMVFCFQVKKTAKNKIAAIVHHDHSCRIQTVNKSNGFYYFLIKEFFKLTGIPCILNTSFNLKGEPIVETPLQALKDFQKTKIDFLVIGKYLVSKN